MLQTNWRKLHVRASITFLVNISERETVHIIKLPNSVKLKIFGCHDTQKILCWGPKQDKTMEIWGHKPESSVRLYMKRWGRKSKERFITNRKIGKWILWASKHQLIFLYFHNYIVVVLRDFPKITNGPYMKMSKT